MPPLNLPRGLWGFLKAPACLQVDYVRAWRDVKAWNERDRGGVEMLWVGSRWNRRRRERKDTDLPAPSALK